MQFPSPSRRADCESQFPNLLSKKYGEELGELAPRAHHIYILRQMHFSYLKSKILCNPSNILHKPYVLRFIRENSLLQRSIALQPPGPPPHPALHPTRVLKCKDLSVKIITCCTTIVLQIILESCQVTLEGLHRSS